MKIEIQQLSKEQLAAKNVFNWPIWEKEISEFDWLYSDAEYCYFLDGLIEVSSDLGTVLIRKGDFVKFPKGLKCVWKVKEAVRKHYYFE